MALLFLLFIFVALLCGSLADVSNYVNDAEYDKRVYGDYPYQRFVSDPNVTAPIFNILTPARHGVSPSKYIFLAPVGDNNPNQAATIIDADTLSLVYQGPSFGMTVGARVQTCNGTDYLTWWAGGDLHGHKNGLYYMMDTSYKIAYIVSPANLGKGDAHEFFLTPECTAIFTVYNPIDYDLTAYHIEPGYLIDSLFQEVDVATNELIFQWRATDHVDIHDSFLTPEMAEQGRTYYNGFDFFHMNSVAKDQLGNYLVDSRHMQSVYYVDGQTGEVLWTLGGRRNQFTDLSDGKATDFAWQHHVRFVDEQLTTLTMFDNGNSKYGGVNPATRGLILKLNTTEMSVTLDRSYVSPAKISSIREGGMQLIPDTDGNVMMSYGNEPAFTEFSRDGEVLWDVRFGPLDVNRASCDNYRTLKMNWTATPRWKPSITRGSRPDTDRTDNKTVVYFSWNGATELSNWLVLASKTSSQLKNSPDFLDVMPRLGFETSVAVDSDVRYIRAVAIDDDNNVLDASRVLDIEKGDTVAAPDVDANELTSYLLSHADAYEYTYAYASGATGSDSSTVYTTNKYLRILSTLACTIAAVSTLALLIAISFAGMPELPKIFDRVKMRVMQYEPFPKTMHASQRPQKSEEDDDMLNELV